MKEKWRSPTAKILFPFTSYLCVTSVRDFNFFFATFFFSLIGFVKSLHGENVRKSEQMKKKYTPKHNRKLCTNCAAASRLQWDQFFGGDKTVILIVIAKLLLSPQRYMWYRMIRVNLYLHANRVATNSWEKPPLSPAHAAWLRQDKLDAIEMHCSVIANVRDRNQNQIDAAKCTANRSTDTDARVRRNDPTD